MLVLETTPRSEYTPEKVAELIAEARDYLDRESNVSQWPNLVSQLADALEEQVQDREMLVMFLRNTEQERDDLDAVIAEVCAYADALHLKGVQTSLRHILSRIPEHPKED